MRYKTTAEVYRETHGHDMPTYASLSKPKRGDSEIAKREKKRMAAIERGEYPVTKEESMEKLGLHARWGA